MSHHPGLDESLPVPAIHRLPFDVLSAIFLALIPPTPWNETTSYFSDFQTRQRQRLICSVCQSWREAALGTATIWTELVTRGEVDFPEEIADRHRARTEALLQRSKQADLSITVHMGDSRGGTTEMPSLNARSHDMVHLLSERLKRLDVLNGRTGYFASRDDGPLPLPATPHLRYLRLNDQRSPPRNWKRPHISLFQDHVNFKLFVLTYLDIRNYLSCIALDSIPVSHLREVYLDGMLVTGNLGHFIASCPNLQHLTLTSLPVSATAAPLPIQSPSLTQLHIKAASATMLPSLPLILFLPRLQHLKLWLVRSTQRSAAATAATEAPDWEPLPELVSLSIDGHPGWLRQPAQALRFAPKTVALDLWDYMALDVLKYLTRGLRSTSPTNEAGHTGEDTTMRTIPCPFLKFLRITWSVLPPADSDPPDDPRINFFLTSCETLLEQRPRLQIKWMMCSVDRSRVPRVPKTSRLEIDVYNRVGSSADLEPDEGLLFQ